MGKIFERPVAAQQMRFTGERLTADLAGETLIEHWHRYLLARELARGLDVLDIASGEGYGAALIAQSAKSVVGVDVSAEAVAHAAECYAAPNLRFTLGDARRIPLDDSSVDLVVSFETIEHLVEHAAFLAEVRRVLRPGGALLVSTPERDNYSPADQPANPFHAHELTEDEFADLLAAHFRHVGLHGQRVMLGSAILGGETKDAMPLCFERRGPRHFEVSPGMARMRYVVALASDEPSWRLPASVYIDTSRIGYKDGETLQRLDEELAALREKAAGFDAVVAEAADLRGRAAELEAALRTALEEASGARARAAAEAAATLRDAEEARARAAAEAAATLRDAEGRAAAAREQAEQEIAGLRRLVASLESSCERAEDACRAARQQGEAAAAEVAMMRASTSWRISRPVRVLGRMLRSR